MTNDTKARITALRDNVLNSIPKDQRDIAQLFGAVIAEAFKLAYHSGLDLPHIVAILKTFAAQAEIESGDQLTLEQQLTDINPPAYVPAAA